MPINPSYFDNVKRDMVPIIELIDEKLKNQSPPTEHSWGDTEVGMRCLHIVLVDTFTVAEKKFVVDTYTKAGWAKVIVKNSEENGERGGLVGIRLYDPNI
jgi:hypothetical protein